MTRAILDRPLTPHLCDEALRLAGQDDPITDKSELLGIVLRDSELAAVAQNKTRTVLNHIWIDPPAHARQMIQWAVEHACEYTDSRALHIGAMLATYPFFGDICAIAGRELGLNGEVSTPELRRRTRAKWGERKTVDNAVQRAVKTLRAFDILTGEPGTSVSTLAHRLAAPPALRPWLVHALLLTRRIREIDDREVSKAPELIYFEIAASGQAAYPYLERFNEGGGRVVWSIRANE